MLLLPAKVTLAEARDALRMLAQALTREPDGGAVIDASGLQQFDSAVLAVLLECQRIAQAWGKGFAVRNAPAKLLALARMYGVDALLSFDSAA
ncbi:MAG: STAS domain-containing protein [Betaproteobacteria bacterium]|nr:MAG: STAS domain-containing protein [Betaproteobacteria bacterium]